jgi:superfamily I DNA and RNA helicase
MSIDEKLDAQIKALAANVQLLFDAAPNKDDALLKKYRGLEKNVEALGMQVCQQVDRLSAKQDIGNKILAAQSRESLSKQIADLSAAQATANQVLAAIARIVASKQPEPGECVWKQTDEGYHTTACGNSWQGNAMESSRVFCPFCGKPIK